MLEWVVYVVGFYSCCMGMADKGCLVSGRLWCEQY